MKKEKYYDLRKEFEDSGLKIRDFATLKSVEVSVMRYRLRQALEHGYPSTRVRFAKINTATTPTSTPHLNSKVLTIRTSYGAVIEIPI